MTRATTRPMTRPMTRRFASRHRLASLACRDAACGAAGPGLWPRGWERPARRVGKLRAEGTVMTCGIANADRGFRDTLGSP